MYVGKAE